MCRLLLKKGKKVPTIEIDEKHAYTFEEFMVPEKNEILQYADFIAEQKVE